MFHQKSTLRGPGGIYVNASEKTKKAEKGGTISASQPKVQKVESNEEDSDFDCYNKSAARWCMSTSTKKSPKKDQHWHYYETNRKKKKQDSRLAIAYFLPNYKYFDQLLQIVKNRTTVSILVFKELLQTSI